MLRNFKTGQVSRFIFISFFLSTVAFSSGAQDTTIVKGKIYTNTDRPLANVSVSIEGSQQLPVVTNAEGEFTVRSGSGNDWIIVSPASGYKMKRVFRNDRDQVDIYLTPDDISSGDDKLAVLSRLVPKRNMTVAYTDLEVRNIYHTNVLTLDQFMQGRVAGLHVVNRSGNPGSGAYLALRGINSINTNNQPLIIMDGVPVTSTGILNSNLSGFAYNPLLELSLYDISRATIIKDPAITAAYGSKASNGLILIETLDPSVTQTTIEVDFRTGLSLSPSNLIPQLNAVQHKTLMQEELFTSGKFEEVIREEYPSLFLEEGDERYIDYQHNTNWQELIFKNSFFNNLSVKVKGGDEIASYGLSVGLINNRGTLRETGYSGYNLRFVSKLNIFTWLKMNAGVSLNYNSSKMKDAATIEETSPILSSLAKSPMLNPYKYDAQGNRLTTLAEIDELGTSNPMATIDNFTARNINYSFISSLGFESVFNRNLILKSKFNLVFNVLKEKIFMPNHGMEHYYNQEAINVSKTTNNDLKTFYNNTYLSFNKEWGGDHVLSSVTGFHVHTNRYELDWGIGKNAHENDQYRDIQDGQPDLREIGGQNRAWNWFSLYENVTYVYRDKYMLTGSLSLDGSSRVGDDAAHTIRLAVAPFGFFYAGGVAWRISGENFLNGVFWLEDLKLRFSVGKTGNDDIGESSATNYYNAVKYRETVGLYPALVPNPGLSYETVTQLNTGLDLALWGNRFTAAIDIFSSHTNNMLIFRPIESYLGYYTRMENAGKLENKGWEISTFFRLMDRTVFKWDVQATLSRVSNTVVDMNGEKLISGIIGAEIVNMEGSPANSYYGYIFKGVYSTPEEANTANLVNDKQMRFRAGDAIFADLSGPDGAPDGVINGFDKTAIGSSTPDYIGGLVNNFTYKKFTLSMMFQWVHGNEVFNYLRYKNEQMTGLENQSSEVLNRWQYTGQVTNVPRALWNDPMGNSAFSTRWIEDGSYVRLKTILLSYVIPNKFLSFRNAEFYVSANNILTFTKYLGYDPEFSYSYSQASQGVDYGMMPQTRQFIVGVKVGL